MPHVTAWSESNLGILQRYQAQGDSRQFSAHSYSVYSDFGQSLETSGSLELSTAT